MKTKPSRNRRWTPAELDELRHRYADEATQRIAADIARTPRACYGMADKLGLRKSDAYLAKVVAALAKAGAASGKSSLFTPGNVPWNAGTKGQGVSGRHPNTVKNYFGPGNRPHGWRPVGSTRVSADGYLQRKCSDTGYPPRDWVPVHRIVWEAAHGPVPARHRVTFRAGRIITDEASITPEALECISPAEAMRRNSLHARMPKPLARLVQLRGQITRQINRKLRERQQQTESTDNT